MTLPQEDLNMIVRDVHHDDVVDVIKIAEDVMHLRIDNYRVDKPIWVQNCLHWVNQADKGEAFFKVAYEDDQIMGFCVGTPVVWHYSNDLYLDIKEVIVEESLPQLTKAKLVKQLTQLAEKEARDSGLKGISAFSIRDDSQAFANFLVKKNGWTATAGAKKIF